MPRADALKWSSRGGLGGIAPVMRWADVSAWTSRDTWGHNRCKWHRGGQGVWQGTPKQMQGQMQG